jgi:hypothetical protein
MEFLYGDAYPVIIQGVLRMIPDNDAYANAERIDPNDHAMVAYWAERWRVTPLQILCAVQTVGPLIREVTVELWKQA